MMPSVVIEAPAEFRAAEAEPPKIAAGTGAERTQWTVLADRERTVMLVAGCVATPIPGWVEDMRPSLEARTIALAGASTEHVSGVPIDARPAGEANLFTLRPASDLGGPAIGTAKTFVGFDPNRVHACFAVCAATSTERRGAAHACEVSAASSRLVGDGPPPKPGPGLRLVTWAVHHPQQAKSTLAISLLACGVLAVITRRRPRTRSSR